MYQDKPPIEDFLMHYGVGHLNGGHSGRYPWGSGDAPFQTSGDFLSRVRELKKQGLREFHDAKTGETYKGEAAIAAAVGLYVNGKPNTNELRKAYTLAKNEERMAQVNRAEDLRNQGYGTSEIGRKMDISESTVRSLLDPIAKNNMLMAQNTADFLKAKLDEKLAKDPKAMIDIGEGSEKTLPDELRISRTKFDDAIYILEGQGYKTAGGRIPQLTDPTGSRQTTINVLGGPEMISRDVYDYDHIYTIKDYISRDNGETYEKKFEYPASMDSKRLMIRYAEDGGKDKDGVIELRRNVPDLSLGESNYAQVRILVDGDRYLKGMALYSDDMPKGVDVVFNTNKKKDVPKMEVLKEIKEDPDNPFGSLIKDADQGGQYHYIDKDGKRKLGLINKTRDEGDWNKWQDTLSSQFLSKQTKELAERQLKQAVKDKKEEYEAIMNLTNDTVKKYYLSSFAGDCDSAAVHLKAAALPRQKFQVILPLTTIKDDEIYAPNFKNGEKVALVRYPHGGIFEIPICTVNNKVAEGEKYIGPNGKDVVGISSKVAERLSGADFDGDTVLVIPTANNKIKTKRELAGLKEVDGSYFDPKTRYATTEKKVKERDPKTGELKEVSHYYNSSGVEINVMKNTQIEMGKISNLITDMTIIGAPDDEIARAVRHSMVVIDAAKHKLDYRSSEQENKIQQLKEKYQGHYDEDGKIRYGAATLISRSKSEVEVHKRKGEPKINIKGTTWYDPTKPEGALVYKEDENATFYRAKSPLTGKKVSVYPTEDGRYKYIVGREKDARGNSIAKYDYLPEGTKVEKAERMEKVTRMANTDDAYTLISEYNSPMEQVYAEYANSMKALANEARKSYYYTKGIKYNPEAAKVYSDEVRSLETKLEMATKNKPRERQAQCIGTSSYKAKVEANPDMTKEEKKKLRQRELTNARARVGAERELIEVTDNEWAAIQSGAIHSNMLTDILKNADMDTIRDKATPKDFPVMTDAMISRARNYANAGKTNAEIAEALGVSASTVSKYING